MSFKIPYKYVLGRMRFFFSVFYYAVGISDNDSIPNEGRTPEDVRVSLLCWAAQPIVLCMVRRRGKAITGMGEEKRHIIMHTLGGWLVS